MVRKLPDAHQIPGKKTPADAARVVAIAREFCDQHPVLRDGSMEQKRQAGDDKQYRRKPGSKRSATCHHDQDTDEITRMPHVGVRPGRDDILPALGLDAHD
jgi:hypothetical protein